MMQAAKTGRKELTDIEFIYFSCGTYKEFTAQNIEKRGHLLQRALLQEVLQCSTHRQVKHGYDDTTTVVYRRCPARRPQAPAVTTAMMCLTRL